MSQEYAFALGLWVLGAVLILASRFSVPRMFEPAAQPFWRHLYLILGAEAVIVGLLIVLSALVRT